MKKVFSVPLFEQLPIIGILRGFSGKSIKKILEIYLEVGFTTIEITMNTDQAPSIIASAVADYGDVLNIGAGTVRTVEDLITATQAGAQFIVTPIVNEPVIAQCEAFQIPIFVGAYTPTEIFFAWQAGATAVKIFPAATGGLAHIKAVKEPLEMIPLLPVGGVTSENIAEFMDIGVYGVGMGGHLFPKSIIETGNWKGLKEQLQKTKSAFEDWKAHQKNIQ